MARTLLWRLAAALATLLLLVVFAFAFLKLAPRGPYDPAPAVTAAVLPKVAAGFDPAQPGYQQFARYLGNALQLNFGPAFRYRDYTVAELLFRGAPSTLETVGCALLFAILVGLVSGCLAGPYRTGWLDRGLSALATFWLLVPIFVLAIMLQLVFAIGLQWAPVAGWDGGWRHMVLPVLTLGLPLAVAIDRLVRRRLTDAMPNIAGRLSNGLAAVSARLGGLTSAGFALSLPLERSFALPGVGRYTAEAGISHDYPLLAGAILFYGGIIVLISLAGDLVRIICRCADEPAAPLQSRSWATLRRDPLALAGAGLFLVAMVACSLLPSGALPDEDYSAIALAPSLSSGHPLGTDELGRDLLQQLLLAGAGSIRLALITAVIAGAILALWRFAKAGGGVLMRGVFDAVPFLLLAIVLRGWLVPIATPMASGIGLVWLVLWLALQERRPLVQAICLALPASLVGEAYLAYHDASGAEPNMTLGGLLASGLGGLDTEPWLVLVPAAAILLLAASTGLVAARMRAAR